MACVGRIPIIYALNGIITLTEWRWTMEQIESHEFELTWEEVEFEDDSRCGSMYCFKSCSTNQN